MILSAEKIQRVKCFMFRRCGICCVLAIFERRRGRLGSKISGWGQLAEVAVYFTMSGLPPEADTKGKGRHVRWVSILLQKFVEGCREHRGVQSLASAARPDGHRRWRQEPAVALYSYVSQPAGRAATLRRAGGETVAGQVYSHHLPFLRRQPVSVLGVAYPRRRKGDRSAGIFCLAQRVQLVRG